MGASVTFWSTTHTQTLILKSIQAFNFGVSSATLDFHTLGPAGTPLVGHVVIPSLQQVVILPWVVYSPGMGGQMNVLNDGPVGVHLSGAMLPGGATVNDGDYYPSVLPSRLAR